MSDCEHVVLYRYFLQTPPKCLVCQPPVRKPAVVGIRQKDGAVWSREDFDRQRRTRLRQGAEQRAIALANKEWDTGGWVVSDGREGRDGWPECSVAGVSYPPPRPLLLPHPCLTGPQS